MKQVSRFLMGAATALALVAVPATRVEAAMLVEPGIVGGSGDAANVISNACNGNITGPAITVQGCFNFDHTYFVNFTSDENLIITGGQAVLTAADGLFSYLEISLASGDTFSKLILNINASDDGLVTFAGNPGSPPTQEFALSGNGNNFFTITGEDFLSVAFWTSVGVSQIDLAEDVRQVRIGGIDTPDFEPDPVSEPTTLLLFGLGLLGAGVARRCVRK